MEDITDKITIAFALVIERLRLQKKLVLSNELKFELQAYLKNKHGSNWHRPEMMLVKALMGAEILESLGESPRDVTEMTQVEMEKLIEDTADKILILKLRHQTQTGN